MALAIDSSLMPRSMRSPAATGPMRMLLAGVSTTIVAGDPHATFEGRAGGVMRTISATTGEALAQCELDSSPIWDGLAAADGRMYMATTDGRVICMGRDDSPL